MTKLVRISLVLCLAVLSLPVWSARAWTSARPIIPTNHGLAEDNSRTDGGPEKRRPESEPSSSETDIKRVSDTEEDKRAQEPIAGKVLPKGATIIVADRTLSGPLSAPQQRGNRIFLPVFSIAQALGDTITVNPLARTVQVRRQDGVLAEFSAPLNQVRENGAVVLVVSNSAEIVFPPGPEELLLPVEIVAALLDVSIFLDENAGAIRVTRGQSAAQTVRAGTKHSSWQLYQLDYSYNLNAYSSSFHQNVALNSIGRILDGKFTILTNLDGGSNRSPLIYRRGTFAFERPSGQRLVAGDFGSGTDLQFMSTALRGGLVQQPFTAFRLTSFGGRALSGLRVPETGIDPSTGLPLDPEVDPGFDPSSRKSYGYDTSVVGSYITFGPSLRDPSRSTLLLYSMGGMYFNGPSSQGQMVSANVNRSSKRNQLLGDVGFGKFSGFDRRGAMVEGVAPLVDVSDRFNLFESLTLHGQFTHIGASFVSPQGGGLVTPRRSYTGGFTWRPARWLTTSASGNSITRFEPGNPREEFATVTLSVSPQGPLPTIMFTHTEGRRSTLGANSYTLVNITKDLNRLRLFSNFTRIRTPLLRPFGFETPLVNPPRLSFNAGAGIKVTDHNNLQVSQSLGSQGYYGGSVDWYNSGLLSSRINFGAGVSYTYTNSSISTIERLVASIQLPRQQMLQFSYVHTGTGPQVIFQLRGPLIRSRNADIAARIPLGELTSLGAFYGKVYQDVNLSGRFEPGVDQPLANVRIRVDGNFYAVSDENGDFRVENIKTGEHSVYLDLLSVRADLTLLDYARQDATLYPGRDSIVDFRLVRTGRLRGTVWLDTNNNGQFDDAEQPLPDVRVVTGSGRDTLTDALGDFVLGDLPPGEHVVLIDEKTLPANTKSATGAMQIVVKAGKETGNVNFPIVPKPADVNVRHFPPSGS